LTPAYIAVADPAQTPWQNPLNRLDVNFDGIVTPLDVLMVINDLNARGSRMLPAPGGSVVPLPYLDVSGNNVIDPLDALWIINHLNALGGRSHGESEVEHLDSPGAGTNATAAADYYWNFLGSDQQPSSRRLLQLLNHCVADQQPLKRIVQLTV
jgi:hypothetical protein